MDMNEIVSYEKIGNLIGKIQINKRPNDECEKHLINDRMELGSHEYNYRRAAENAFN